jgi:class 3 adenylate cyclase
VPIDEPILESTTRFAQSSWLRFDDPRVERDFRQDLARQMRFQHRILWPALTVVIAAQILIDPLALPDAAIGRISWIRYAINVPALALVGAFGWAPIAVFTRYREAAVVAGALVTLLSIAAMSIPLTPGPDMLLCYALVAVLLCVFGVYTHVGLRCSVAAATAAIGSIVNVVALAVCHEPPEKVLFVAFWFLSANVIGAIGGYTLERYRRRDFVQMRVIADERAKSDKLLLNILPAPVAERLKAGATVIADDFQDATILFADIVGFTQLSQRLSPAELVALLDRLFSAFDELTDRFGLEKIKTIGDAYMVAGGIPEPVADHAAAMADMALAMRDAASAIAESTGLTLGIRIGIHSGPVVAGVIGKRKFVYDLWGDAVNTASRMESHGIVGEIQVTEALWQKLRDRFELERRGPLLVKGKGELVTYLLRGRVGRPTGG